MTERCKNCRFWKCNGANDEDYGLCRIRAPSTTSGYERTPSIKRFVTITAWPETECDDWCGEFQPKDSE